MFQECPNTLHATEQVTSVYLMVILRQYCNPRVYSYQELISAVMTFASDGWLDCIPLHCHQSISSPRVTFFNWNNFCLTFNNAFFFWQTNLHNFKCAQKVIRVPRLSAKNRAPIQLKMLKALAHLWLWTLFLTCAALFWSYF